MDDVVTISLDHDLSAALDRAAEAARKSPAEYVRGLIREHVAVGVSDAEIARQCRVVAEAGREPGSDEAAVTAELDLLLADDPFGDEWKA